MLGYVGVTVDTAATVSGSVTPRRSASSRLMRITAAPPSEVAQISSRRSGSATIGEASTSSTVTSLR